MDPTVRCSCGARVAGPEGRYGYVIYVRPEEMSRATEALGV
jgi:hypothetical protein